jgi:DNA (cytosine-5)-methyltransferase 1
MSVAIVDVFCGIGGLTHGLGKAGLNVVAGIDNDPSCQFAYEANNKAKFIKADVSNYKVNDLKKLFGNADIKILVGCAPCQTFSAHANKYRKKIDTTTDFRWNLLMSFARYVKEIKPDIVSMENVPALQKFDVFQEFKQSLEIAGYFVWHKVVDCAKYGLPQNRHRLVLLASKRGDIRLISPDSKHVNDKRTVRDAIGDLPLIQHGQTHEDDPLHRSAGLTPINVKRIKQSKPGGTWRDWDKDLLPNCYRKESGKTFRNVYGRMRWDKPSPTITTQFYAIGTGRYGHPKQDRALSLREGALLQTFPDGYKFFKDENVMSIATIGRHIGNAVPVELGRIIGISIKEHLKEVKKCRHKPKR